MSERTQPLLDLLSGLALSRFLAEEDDHLLGLDASALAARDQPLGQLPGGGGPVVPVLGDAEPGPAAEPAPSVLVVQGDQDDAVLGVVAEQIGQGVGEFGGGAQGDLLFAAVAAVGGAGDVLRAPCVRARALVRALPRDLGAAGDVVASRKAGLPVSLPTGDVAVLGGSVRVVAVRHGRTISRIRRSCSSCGQI